MKGVFFEVEISPLQAQVFAPAGSGSRHQQHHTAIFQLTAYQCLKEDLGLFLRQRVHRAFRELWRVNFLDGILLDHLLLFGIVEDVPQNVEMMIDTFLGKNSAVGSFVFIPKVLQVFHDVDTCYLCDSLVSEFRQNHLQEKRIHRNRRRSQAAANHPQRHPNLFGKVSEVSSSWTISVFLGASAASRAGEVSSLCGLSSFPRSDCSHLYASTSAIFRAFAYESPFGGFQTVVR